MANANLKPRRACGEKSESISLYWSSFQPGQPVLFRVDYRLGHCWQANGAERDTAAPDT
jgi:hypothetical protein